jgi:GNAT superfamily N-acetyltransferase
MIELIEINASDWLEQAEHLMIEHWEEVAKDTGVPKPSMDGEYLASMEAAGMLFTVGAFVNEELVGYSMNSIGSTINFDTLIVMENQGIFIKKQYRGSLAGIRLIKESERIGKERGASICKWHTYMNTRADKLFDSLGYKAYDILYTKEL